MIERLELAVVSLEARTSAEVVISAAPQSGRYGDVDLLWGWICGLVALSVILWGPWSFHPDFVLVNVIFGGLVGWLASRRLPALRRLLTTPGRRARQVEEAARLEFLLAGVDRTSSRTGILVHVSRLERRLTVVLDRAVEGRLPASVAEGWLKQYGQAPSGKALLDQVPDLLSAMADSLASHLPPVAGRVDELENRPRIRA